MQTKISGVVSRFCAAFAILSFLTLTPATAQNWPSKSLTLIVPYAAGTGTDYVARVVAEGISQRINQQIIVENRPGAGATIGASSFAKAAPDGYTFMLTGASPVVNAPQLYRQLSYDPTKFTPIGMVMSTPIMLIVSADTKANSLQELIAFAKANPGVLSAGDIGAGSTHQLLDLILERAADIKLNHVSYKGSPMLDLVAGRINIMLDYPGQYSGHVKDGKVRILANLHSKRHANYPNVPTMAEGGVPAYPDWLGWFAVYGPSGLPADIVSKMNAAMNDFLKSPEAAQKFAVQEYIPAPSTPEEVTKKVDQETAVLSKIIKENNIALD